MDRVCWQALFLLFAVNSISCWASSRSKGASITLTTGWKSTPLILEAGEFLAEQNDDLFWQYVDAWGDAGKKLEGSCWTKIHRIASDGLSKGVSELLGLSISLREFSAKLEMYRQIKRSELIGESSCCVAKVGTLGIARNSDELVKLLDGSNQLGNLTNSGAKMGPRMFEFDHEYFFEGSRSESAITVVLYGAFGTNCFTDLHRILSKKAGEGSVRYILRPVLAPECSETDYVDPCVGFGMGDGMPLPGFGIEFALKSTEYSAVNEKERQSEQQKQRDEIGEIKGFNFDKLVERKPNLKQELLTFRDHLVSTESEEASLKVWEMKDLGVQASQRIIQSSDPISLMTEISQNFPSLAPSLSRLEADGKLRTSVKKNQRIMPQKFGMGLLNGLPVDLSDFDLFTFLKRVKNEVQARDQLIEIGLNFKEVSRMLRLRAYDATEDISDLRFDIWGKNSVIFLNNLESDAMYRSFRPSVESLLTAYYPGELIPVAKNLYTAVLIVDITSEMGLQAANAVVDLYEQEIPVRFGLFPLVPSVINRVKNKGELCEWDKMEASEKGLRAFLTIKSAFGQKSAFAFWASMKEYSRGDIEGAFKASWVANSKTTTSKKGKSAAKLTVNEAWEQVKEGSGHASGVGLRVQEYAESAIERGLSFIEGSGMLWMNGIMSELSKSNLEGQIMQYAMYEMQNFQEQIYYGRLSDSTKNVLSFILKKEGAVKRYNPKVLGLNKQDMPREVLLVPSILSKYKSAISGLQYMVYPKSTTVTKEVTHWVVADLSSKEGLALVKESLRFVGSKSADKARVGVISNHYVTENAPVTWLEVLWYRLPETVSENGAILGFWTKVMDTADLVGGLMQPAVQSLEQSIKDRINEGLTEDNVPGDLFSDANLEGILDRINAERQFASKFLGILEKSSGVVANGRVVECQDGSMQCFTMEDFLTMQKIASEFQLGEEIGQNVEGLDAFEDRDDLSDPVQYIASVLRAAHVDSKYTAASLVRIQQGLKEIKGVEIKSGIKDGTSAFEFQAVINPLTKSAQKLSQILQFFQSAMRPKITLHLNPNTEMSEMPLKQYYRYALPNLDFTTDGYLETVTPPVAYFSSLPARKVLTLNPDVPEMWLVEPVNADHDLDNLRMEEIGIEDALFVEYRLENLLLTGSCLDFTAKTRSGVYPRGLQLVLGDQSNPHSVDTLVMSNLGYFQLKASPGVWELKLADGASQDLFTLDEKRGVSTDTLIYGSDGSHNNDASKGDLIGTSVHIDSLDGKDMVLRVKKRPGKETEDVLGSALGAEHVKGGWLDSVVSMFKGSGKSRGKASKSGCEHADDPINIFTIASGHMYERLQKIMVLSVLKNTKSCVKFWFIKNYMSPQMKDFLPYFSEKYGFQYETVTYKWPSWLNKQTEKQRIIWAYKILFLDVLFPLNVPKVIFVDADQIIRTDMRELYDMNIDGAPLAYTPFCDSNTEMDGFRFWKGGFWKDHLRGKPYHISALYVVDLNRFRQMAAGDKLRVLYENLSKDPNSLANLDQDLPNYAQHKVRIFSLPQEWLWCESWCGNETKSNAKTIDLCNNPLTKEPKLSAARRIVGEWPGLDTEALSFTEEVERKLATVGLDSEAGNGSCLEAAGDCEIETAGPEVGGDRHDDTEL